MSVARVRCVKKRLSLQFEILVDYEEDVDNEGHYDFSNDIADVYG